MSTWTKHLKTRHYFVHYSYNNDAVNNVKYGKLYNWYVVSKTTNGNKNVCPQGWHVSTDIEWAILTDYLGGLNIAGGKLKEAGLLNWSNPNKDATNSSLFTGLPGGYRDNGGGFGNVGNYGHWWSISENLLNNTLSYNLSTINGVLLKYTPNSYTDVGLSIRCLKD